MKIHSFKVTPNLPENMKFLEELSNNMWFAWNWPAIILFLKIGDIKMQATVFCKTTAKATQSFFVKVGGRDYFLCGYSGCGGCS